MSDVTLSEAAARYIASLKHDARGPVLAEMDRFVRGPFGIGEKKLLSGLRGHDISLYAEALGPNTPDAAKRAEIVRAFLAYLKKEKLTETNLAPHLRLRKASKVEQRAGAGEEATVELTQEGIDSLKAELEALKAQRLEVREDIRHAMLDKDFRENAPLDAAKEKQGHLEARIRQIEGVLKQAVVVDGALRSGQVQVGRTVTVKNVNTGSLFRYTIVGPTEASASNGRISSVSPVGKALLNRTVGDQIEVSVPAGSVCLRIESIEG